MKGVSVCPATVVIVIGRQTKEPKCCKANHCHRTLRVLCLHIVDVRSCVDDSDMPLLVLGAIEVLFFTVVSEDLFQFLKSFPVLLMSCWLYRGSQYPYNVWPALTRHWGTLMQLISKRFDMIWSIYRPPRVLPDPQCPPFFCCFQVSAPVRAWMFFNLCSSHRWCNVEGAR